MIPFGADMSRELLAPGDASGRFFGVVVGIVTNHRDPEGLHRVKVRFPWLAADVESAWARVATPMAGGGRGLYLLPEPDDEVLVAFEHGSLEHPFVVGALWNGKDEPPESNADGKNAMRSLTSRSGHVIRLCDAEGGERIEIVDKTGANRIVIDSTAQTVSIEAQGDIAIRSATGTMTLAAQGDIAIRSAAGRVVVDGVGVGVQSKADVRIQATTTLDASAGATASLQGAVVKIN